MTSPYVRARQTGELMRKEGGFALEADEAFKSSSVNNG